MSTHKRAWIFSSSSAETALVGCQLAELGKRQVPQVFRSFGRPIARCEERALVSLQQLNPVGDVTRTAHVAVKAELGTEERGTQFGHQFLSRIGTLPEAVL